MPGCRSFLTTSIRVSRLLGHAGPYTSFPDRSTLHPVYGSIVSDLSHWASRLGVLQNLHKASPNCLTSFYFSTRC
jgi:hypothetical protein